MARKSAGRTRFEDILFGPLRVDPEISLRISLFVYDHEVFADGGVGWLPEHRARPATVHGRLLRGPRRRYGLIPGLGGLVKGLIVEVEPTQLPVLDFVAGAGGGPFRREAIEASVNLVPTPAQTWILVDDRGFRPLARRN